MKGNKKGTKTCKLCGWPVAKDENGDGRFGKNVEYCYQCISGIKDLIFTRIFRMTDRELYKLFRKFIRQETGKA